LSFNVIVNVKKIDKTRRNTMAKRNDNENDKDKYKRIRAFDGHFTDELRTMLVEKRISLGLSREDVAAMVGCQRTTVFQWETGKVKYCRPQYVLVLRTYLQGKLDKLLIAAILRAARTSKRIDFSFIENYPFDLDG